MQSQLWQYIVVFIILAAVIVWILVRLFSKKPRRSSCCGCSLADTCSKPKNQPRQAKKSPSDLPDCCKQKSR